MSAQPLHHIVRVRTVEDLAFLRAGVMDEVLINANQLENSPDSTAAALSGTELPYSIDPMLYRFQKPAWWRNPKGETKRNYARLGKAYVQSTSIELPAGPIVDVVASEKDWRILAGNVIDYQLTKLDTPTQLDLLAAEVPLRLRPVRLNAPALVADSHREDRVNRVMAEASVEAAGQPVALPVIVPLDRLGDSRELDRLIQNLLIDSVSTYLIWTPRLSEERLLSDHRLFSGLLRLVSSLSERGVPVGHLHATYSIAALRDVGIAALVHHLGWIDRGEPAEQTGGGPRSCQTYVPGVRHSARFDHAYELGRKLDADAYAERYCSCEFCRGAFDAGTHPLDLLLESEMVSTGRGGERPTPTSRAVGVNIWHYLLSRRQEIEAFSALSAARVIQRDIARAAALTGARDVGRLRRLADELEAA
jgi:hypothetical protein